MSENPELPWPVPDQRFRHFVGDFADMHDLVRDLVIPDGLPSSTVSVLTTARELIRHSYFRYEFMMLGVAMSIIAIETALTARYGRGSLAEHLKKAHADGTLDEEQYDLLDTTGRPIRNKFAHGDLTHAAITPALAVAMAQTSFTILAQLHATPEPMTQAE
ncbi:hypothetical protein ABZ517_05630 [Streptomyces scabiei]|uniref:hypothetical protein n=1 Tax=Streptomyces scabiei TaxID=1930 RepID=UPI0033F7F54A